jgi:SAM-dependent methyltransferase
MTMALEGGAKSGELRVNSTMSAATPLALNYHGWVYGSFAPYLKVGTALEVGSGHGIYARMLARSLESVIVSDIDPVAVEGIRQGLAGVSNVDYRVMDGVDVNVLGRRVDNVVLVNVLEHIEQDGVFLRDCFDSLQDGGRLVVFTPAFPMLYSRLDSDAGHYRRYTRRGLLDLVKGAGFEIIAARLFNAVGFFGWYANKLLGSGLHSRHTNAQVLLYDRLVPLLRRVDSLIPFVGQSLLVVGTKPAGVRVAS